MNRRAVALLAAATSGCALATATPPRVDVASVQLRGVGLLDQQLEVGLCAYNPNDRALAFRRIDVGVDVAGTPLANGASETVVSLPPHQSVLVPFAVATTVRNLGPQLAAVLSSGTVPYRLHGTVRLEGSLGFVVPFSRSGRLDVMTAGQALLSDPATVAGATCGSAL